MNSFIFIAEMQLTLSKGCIIILNDLQLPCIFSFLINRQAVCLATCILGAAWVRTVRGEVTNYILDIGKLEFLTSVCAVCIGMRHLSASLATLWVVGVEGLSTVAILKKKQNVNLYRLFLLILQEVYILVLMIHTYVLILVL